MRPACAPNRRASPRPARRLLYTQVPALSFGDRGLLDLLTLDRNGRLAVIELKADEDLHLPLQALDYWIRVRALNADRQPAPGSGPRRSPPSSARATFPAPRFLSSRHACCSPPPPCAFIPPTSRSCAIFRPHVEWELIALTEHWRRELKIVFRKRSQ